MDSLQEKHKHGLAAGDSGRPDSPDWTVPQGWERYAPAEHALWKALFERQARLLPGRACREFVQGMRDLSIDSSRIPDFRRLSDVLMRRTGWQVVAVPGLVPDEVFFEHIANRRFPAGNFLRKPEEMDYLEEPDVFHDVFGHVPMLLNPALADFIQTYGERGLRAQALGRLKHLARVYWYTVEFGLLQEGDALRIYGAGIASSYAESQFCIDSPSPNRIRFALERVMRTQYRIDDFQESYFVIRDLEELLEFNAVDFEPLYERAASQAELQPGDVQAADLLFSRGDGRHHLGRRRGTLK